MKYDYIRPTVFLMIFAVIICILIWGSLSAITSNAPKVSYVRCIPLLIFGVIMFGVFSFDLVDLKNGGALKIYLPLLIIGIFLTILFSLLTDKHLSQNGYAKIESDAATKLFVSRWIKK